MKEHELMFIIIIFIAIIITIWIVKRLSKFLDFILEKLVKKIKKKWSTNEQPENLQGAFFYATNITSSTPPALSVYALHHIDIYETMSFVS